MASSRVFPLLFLLPLIAAAAPPPESDEPDEFHQLWSHNCDDGFGYNTNSTFSFRSNRHKVLNTLSTTTNIPYGFLNLSVGKGLDNAGVTVLCRGDVDAAACHTCVDFVTSKLAALCPDKYEAFGTADNCSVEFSRDGLSPGFWAMNPILSSVSDTYVKNVDHFSAGLRSLLESLPDRAASGDSRLKFATAEANVTADHRVYALTQCTPDLSTFVCRGCLSRATYFLFLWAGVRGRTGGRWISPSCSARYELHKFYSSPDPPPSSVRSSNGKGSGRSKTVIIAVVSVIACLSLLTNFLLLCFWRRRETKPMADMELDEELHTYREHNKQAYNVFRGSYARQ